MESARPAGEGWRLWHVALRRGCQRCSAVVKLATDDLHEHEPGFDLYFDPDRVLCLALHPTTYDLPCSAPGAPQLERLTPGVIGTSQYAAPELINEDLQVRAQWIWTIFSRR